MSPKAQRIEQRLEALQRVGDETLKQVAAVILENVKFYEKALQSWERKDIEKKWSAKEIELGKKCGNAGLDMADIIVNDLRILYLDQERKG